MSSPLVSTVLELEAGRESGLHSGGQLYVSVDGQIQADLAFGEARPGEPMTREHLMLWMSSSKPVTVVALAKLWEAGRLELDDPVVRHLPEFGAHGKGGITLRHLLTHTAGIRTLTVGWPKKSWEEIVADVAGMKPEPRWVPGERAGYHTQSSWFILGEVVARLHQASLAEILRREVFEPIGMRDSWIGMPREQYLDYGRRICPVWDTSKPEGSPSEIGWDSELHLTHCNPAGSGYGPVRELGTLYEMLLGDGAAGERSPGLYRGQRILQSPTVAAITSRHRVGMRDRTFRKTLDWGLGVILNSAHYGESEIPYSYGQFASRETFGHSGARSSTAFADPRHGLVVALAVNGMADDAAHRERFARLTTKIYEDLGIATDPSATAG